MYCKNCGSTCNNGDTVCSNCGKSLEVSYYTNITPEVKKEEVYTKEDNDKANLISAISLLCFIAPFLITGLFLNSGLESLVSNLISLLELASFVLMIYVRVKYPKNIFAKVLMWFYIVAITLMIILVAVFFFACFAALASCPG